MSEQHIFAIYDKQLTASAKARSYTCINSDMIHRISRVLRLDINDTVILFNRAVYAQGAIQAIGRDKIAIQLEATQPSPVLKPEVTFLLPLLKKDALSNAVYGLVEAGVSSIQLVTTQKTQRPWGGDHELERLSRVAIAAAEQAKHYAFPEIKAPKPLAQAVSELSPASLRYYGDPQGASWVTAASSLDAKKEIVLLIGPEGDLTMAEKQLVQAAHFKPVALTPTILRAESAAFCMVCLFRAAL